MIDKHIHRSIETWRIRLKTKKKMSKINFQNFPKLPLIYKLWGLVSLLWWALVFIKCYNDITYIFVAIEYYIYGFILGVTLEKFKVIKLFKIILQNNFIKNILFVVLILGLIYVNYYLFCSLLGLLYDLNFFNLNNYNVDVILDDDSYSLDKDEESKIIINESSSGGGNGWRGNYPNKNPVNPNHNPSRRYPFNPNPNSNIQIPTNTNIHNPLTSLNPNPNSTNDILTFLQNTFSQGQFTFNWNITVNEIGLSVPNWAIYAASTGFGFGVGIGAVRQLANISNTIYLNSPQLTPGSRIVTTVGVFVVGITGLWELSRIAPNINANINHNIQITGILPPEQPGSTNPGIGTGTLNFNNQGTGGGNSALRSGGGNSTSSMDDLSTNNFDYLINYLTESVNTNNNSSMLILSTIDDTTYIENILNHLLKLEYCILSLSIIMFNIMLIRFLLRNYKELVKKILNIITFNKLDLDRIAYKILNYNLRFYNIIWSISLVLVLIFKGFSIITYYLLYQNSLNYVVEYMLTNNIIQNQIIDGNNTVIFNNLDFTINSQIENYFLLLIFTKMFILLLILLNLIFYFKNRTINKYFISLTIILLVIGNLINMIILLDINSNFNWYIIDFINIHIKL